MNRCAVWPTIRIAVLIATGTFWALIFPVCISNGIADEFQNPQKPYLLAFVSSAPTVGDMSGFSTLACPGTGVSNADCGCQSLAQSAGLTSKSSSFRAFLSTSSTDAICHILGKSGTVNNCTEDAKNSPRYKLANGSYIADTAYDLITGGPSPYLNADEYGTPIATQVWTGTGNQGSGSGLANCNNWSSNVNTSSGVFGDNQMNIWLNSGSNTCDISYPVYCFEAP